MAPLKKIIIIGGGQSTAYAAKEIRSFDTDCELTIIEKF